ncbi:MAG: transporter substrate-binding domain-containing protein [Paludibacter sp.]|nr:transporter substrate-binding domain-containing protein [Paludibacter sp.]
MSFKSKYIFILTLLLFIFFTFSSCKKVKVSFDRDLNEILKSGRLAVLIDSSSLGYAVSGDSISGFQYEIVKAFADSLGVELQITKQNDLGEAILSLENGENDLIANFLPVTSEFKKLLLFSDPLITTRQMLVQRMTGDTVHYAFVKTQTDLTNDTIFLPANSPFIMRIKHLSDEIAEEIYIQEMKNVNFEDMIRLVSEGKIKNTICPEQFVKKYQNQYSNVDFSMPLGFNQHYAWAVHVKSTLLLEKLNDFLADFIGSSAYWKIYRKYC